jgi:glycosyltransferase involved in cell wall biosynthesis
VDGEYWDATIQSFQRRLKTPVSVLVPVKNEAGNLRDCLASVSFADEIVVVDSGSTDGTAEIASEFGARIVQFEWNGGFPRKKNWALENVPWRHEWVLILDADERITPALEKQIREAIQRDDVDGFYLNRRYWFLDGWINHSGYFPSWNLRLFRHRKGRYERFETTSGPNSGDNEVHEHVLLDGRAEYLSEPMEHYAFPDIATFREKHERYATWEAQVREQWTKNVENRNSKVEDGNRKAETRNQKLEGKLFGSPLERRRWLKLLSLRMPFRPTLRFIYHYIVRQGFRDGYRGWKLSRLMAWYEGLISRKAQEMRQKAETLKR